MFIHVPPFLQGVESHSFTSQNEKYTRVKIKSERDSSLSRNAGQIQTSTVHWFSGDFLNWLGCYTRYGESRWNVLEHALLN